jgi:hypothetical protein
LALSARLNADVSSPASASARASACFFELLKVLAGAYPMASYQRLYVVVDDFGIYKAKAMAEWLAQHRHIELLFVPTYCPKANPIGRIFWEVHDKSAIDVYRFP